MRVLDVENRVIPLIIWTTWAYLRQTCAPINAPRCWLGVSWRAGEATNKIIMATGKSILLINGPNLNLLGSREPNHYGTDTLQAIEARLTERARKAGASLATYQSNSEADLVERIQQAGRDRTDFILINPAAYTHTSVAMRDALSAVGIPFIEIHLSNVFARESFRRESYFTDIAVGIIGGLGAKGYELALDFALQYSAGE
jgi:3-dehydroquinate dehydratase II